MHLTDRQKADIIWHKRNKKTGEVTLPKKSDVPDIATAADPSTKEDHMAAADLVAAICAATNPTNDKGALRKKMADDVKARLREKGLDG